MKKFENYTPEMACDYWLANNQVNDSERDYLERTIATNAFCSYYYARFISKKPFPLGESLIFSSKYIRDYIDFLIETNQIDKSTIFDYDNSTKHFLGKFLDGKI